MNNLMNSSHFSGAAQVGRPSIKNSYQVLVMYYRLYAASSTDLSLEHPRARNAMNIPSKKR